MQNFSLEDDLILLTGASGHLGSAIAEALASAGACVLLNGRNEKNLLDLQKKLEKKNYRTFLTSFDVTNEDAVDENIKRIERQFGKLDGLVNNAYFGCTGTINSTTPLQIEESLRMSITAPFMLMKKLLPLLEQSTHGAVVNISSMYGLVSPDPELYETSGMNNPPFYGAGKGGLIQLTRYMACHLAEKNIRVNTISPGPFPQDSIVKNEPKFYNKLCGKVPMKRIGKPEELAYAVQFLLSPAASYITGINLPVDGGWTAW